LNGIEPYVDQPAGIYRWRGLLLVLASSAVAPWLGELGFDPDDAGIFTRAARASKRIDLALGDHRGTGAAEFRAVSILALEGALDELTPSEQEVFLDLGSITLEYGRRAFAWSLALRQVSRHPEGIPTLVSKQHVDEVHVWVGDHDRQLQLDDDDYEYDLDDDDDAIQGRLAELLRLVWFRRFVRGFVSWPIAERAALVQYAQEQAPAPSIAAQLNAEQPAGIPME
jgi:hypothetical protein